MYSPGSSPYVPERSEHRVARLRLLLDRRGERANRVTSGMHGGAVELVLAAVELMLAAIERVVLADELHELVASRHVSLDALQQLAVGHPVILARDAYR